MNTSQEKEREISVHFRQINAINTISSLIAIAPTLVAIYTGLPLIYFFFLVIVQIFLLIGISFYKYHIEKNARKIEIKRLRYILDNTMSYAVMSISLPLLFFLLVLFYSLSSIQRVVTINLLFTLALLFILSNLPAYRFLRISRPLEDSYLIDRANEISEKLGTGKLGLFIMNLGKMKIANAGQVGTRKYSVFITDFLLENLSPEENVAVIAHEFAHAKQKHVLKSAILAWSLSVATGNMMVYPVDVGTYPVLAVILPAAGFFLLVAAYMFLLPAVQRRFETQADIIAASVVDGMDLVNALQKITRLNFTPSDISSHWNLDHPPTRERVKNIISYTEKIRSGNR